MPSQKTVLKLDLNDDKDKKKATEIVSGYAVITVHMEDKKLTVFGTTDPVELINKLRMSFSTEIISVGPAKEAQKEDNKKDSLPEFGSFPFACYQILPPPQPFPDHPAPPVYNYGRYTGVEEPPSCVIC